MRIFKKREEVNLVCLMKGTFPETADEIAGDPNAEGAAALGRREPQLREGATPLVDALVTVCVVERDTFKPVSLRRTFPDLYVKYEDIVEGA